MKLWLLAIGTRMPAWVDSGVEEYTQRMPPHLPIHVRPLEAAKRGKGQPVERCLKTECERLLQATPKNAHIILLDRTGETLSSEALAQRMDDWMAEGQDVAFWIGGPEGVHQDCIAQARNTWSLSKLTFAHPVARLVLTEQLYRAWSINAGLPYHK